MIVSCQHIKKYHGANVVLEDVTVEVDEGQRIGLIGRNGSGKSTLLQLIGGELQPDGGQISVQKGARIGYLRQIPAEGESQTVYQVLAAGYRDVLAYRSQLADLEGRMAAPLDERQLAPLLKQYAELQERFQREGGYEMDANIQQVANGLAIPAAQFDRPFASLSGGEKTKVALGALLIERPTLLLLDEPTNHLDTKAIEWLESFLNAFNGACLVVSHDRYFLDRVVTKITELEDGESCVYHTNYTGYVKEKEERLLQQFADYKGQQKQIKQMKEAISRLLEWGRVGDNGKFFRRAASMQKALDRMEKVKRPVMERRAADFDLQPADRSGKQVLVIEALVKRFGDRLILNQVDGLLRYGEKVVLVGQNGAGKSTLFKLLLGEEQPDAGAVRLGARVAVGYLAQEDLPDGTRSVLQRFCDEAVVEVGEGRRLLARYLFYGADVFKQLNQLSGGEWTRLRLALLMHKRPNLLLLDEPTNHLDIDSREALEEALEEFPGTVLTISHDRYFINRLAESIWELQDGNLTGYLGNYDDYKEKRDERRLATERVPPVAAPSAKRPSAEQSRRVPSAERTKAQLEQAIAQAEGQLAEMDAALGAAGSEFERLGALWSEREPLQAKLDDLLLQWLELAE
jgi:ATP-binding cassette subfamily F protein 3